MEETGEGRSAREAALEALEALESGRETAPLIQVVHDVEAMAADAHERVQQVTERALDLGQAEMGLERARVRGRGEPGAPAIARVAVARMALWLAAQEALEASMAALEASVLGRSLSADEVGTGLSGHDRRLLSTVLSVARQAGARRLAAGERLALSVSRHRRKG